MSWRDELNWTDRLNAYLAAGVDRYRHSGFSWGTMDCATWAGDWVKEVTGRDPIEQFRGRYGSAKEAAAALRDLAPPPINGKKQGTFFKAIIAAMGEPIPINKAMPGDLCYRAHEKALGIVYIGGPRKRGAFLYARRPDIGIMRDRQWDAAFRVE